MVDIDNISQGVSSGLLYGIHHIEISILCLIREDHRIFAQDEEVSTSHRPSIRPPTSSTVARMEPIQGRWRGRGGGRGHCDSPTQHPVLGKDVTNLRTITLLTYIILNNYLENINLQKYFIYIHRSGIYSVLYIYSESHLLVLLHLHYLQNLTFTFTKSIQTYL